MNLIFNMSPIAALATARTWAAKQNEQALDGVSTQQTINVRKATKFSDRIKTELDTNGDGQISAEEFNLFKQKFGEQKTYTLNRLIAAGNSCFENEQTKSVQIKDLIDAISKVSFSDDKSYQKEFSHLIDLAYKTELKPKEE